MSTAAASTSRLQRVGAACARCGWARSMPCWSARPSGVIHIRTAQVLAPYHAKLSEPLEHWAKAAPDRVFLGAARRAKAAGAR